MCGIVGIISPSKHDSLRPRVQRALSCLVHRGPDDEGLWCDGPACLGHRRLSIIDLSSGGHQPMISQDESAIITYNGEIYNYRELRELLEEDGCIFRSTSDTEVLLQAYLRWGEDVLLKLKGFFAFAIWNRKTQQLFCARDPFGKKPFYYRWVNGEFLFASEIEALLQMHEQRPKIESNSLSHYLWKGYYAPGTTIYQHVSSLKAGCFLRFDARNARCTEFPYSELKFRVGDTTPNSYPDFLEECSERLSTAVRRRLQSDVPVGFLLSGGVDSSLVSLTGARQSPERTDTFSAAFDGHDYDETPYALEVARKASSRHSVVRVGMEEIPALLPKLVVAYGEPFGDESALPTYALFHAIRNHAKVFLTGDGGDEVFGGYKDLSLFLWREAISPCIGVADLISQSWLNGLMESKRRRVRSLSFALRALQSDSSDLIDSLYRGGWTPEWRRRFFRQEHIGDVIKSDSVSKQTTDLERYLSDTLQRLTQCFLVKIDRASMAHSLEVRSPFLDIDLFHNVCRMPSAMLWKGKVRKRVLKDMLAREMGRSFSRRMKQGFTPPISAWMRRADVASWLGARLSSPQSFISTLMTPESVRSLIESHVSGYDHSGRLWKLLFLDEWFSKIYENSLCQ